jgi:hypothetical protein
VNCFKHPEVTKKLLILVQAQDFFKKFQRRGPVGDEQGLNRLIRSQNRLTDRDKWWYNLGSLGSQQRRRKWCLSLVKTTQE